MHEPNILNLQIIYINVPSEYSRSSPRDCISSITVRADSDAKKSIKEGTDSKILLPVAYLEAQCKKKGNELHSFCQNTETDSRGMARLPGSAR
jgi:hypothetical protein